MRVLVTGAGGQLGSDLVKLLAAKGIDRLACTRKTMDITSIASVRRTLKAYRPDVVIHTAAYTSVDKAEKEEDLAYLINADATRNIAVVAQELNAKMCYISTDYVFDGKKSTPYVEDDPVNPLGVYGKSKLAGEEYVKSLVNKYFVVRTSWVFGMHGDNFVKTMLRLASEKEEIGVVYDQIGSPTYTVDLANFLLQLIQTENFGIFHASNKGATSWYEFAATIFRETNKTVTVTPIATAQYPTLAPRPKYSALDGQKIRSNGLNELPPWQEALKAFLATQF